MVNHLGRKILAYSPWAFSLFWLTVLLVGLLPLSTVQAEESFINSAAKQMMYTLVVNLFGWFVYVGGFILDVSIKKFVIDFGTNFNTSGVGEVVNHTWSLVRDFLNIAFIFGLIYIGFKMVLGIDESGAKKSLLYLILAALLINFSLFITKFIVDFSNIIAAEVLESSFPKSEANERIFFKTEDDIAVAETFFGYMGLFESLDIPREVTTGDNAPWGYIFGSAALYIIAAYTFAIGGIMLLVRFVALNFYMLLSPLMFIGWIFPQLNQYSKKYWSGFLGQALYAPVYAVLLFFVANVLQGFFGTGGSLQSSNGLLGSIGASEIVHESSFFGILIPFILVCAFMMMAVKAAGKLSTDGALVGTTAIGSGVLRKIHGKAERMSASPALWGVNATGDLSRRGLRRVNTNLAQHGGWVGRKVAGISEATLGTGIDKITNARVTGIDGKKTETLAEFQKLSRATQADLNKAAQSYQRSKDEKYGQMTDEEILRLSKKKLKDPEVLRQLTAGHIKALAESGRFNNATIDGMKKDRINGIVDHVTEPFSTAGASAEELGQAFSDTANTLRRMDAETKASLDNSVLEQERVAVHLSDDDLSEMQKTGKKFADDIASIRTARDTALENIAKGDTKYGRDGAATTAANAGELKKFNQARRRALMSNPQNAGKLSPAIFAERDMAEFITPAALTQLVRNRNLDEDQQKAIESNLRIHITNPDTSSHNITRWEDWSKKNEGRIFNLNIDSDSTEGY